MTATGKRKPRPTTNGESASLLTGRATPAATHGFADRFRQSFATDFYRDVAGLTVSSIGMGTYLGECDDAEDERYVELLLAGVGRGLNLLDTAINYRCQRSERAVGQAVRRAIVDGKATREELVVCTKGGYVPLEGAPPESREEYNAYLESQYFGRGTMSRGDLVAGGHCLTPRFLTDQIERSLANLELDCIDIFYLHNPEQQLDTLDRPRFMGVMRGAFAELESQAKAGRIGAYGCATWNGFRVFAASRNHLSLPDLVGLAREVGGSAHHFRAIQLPVNLAMTEAIRSPTQSADGKNVPLLGLAEALGVSVVASASLMQSQLTRDLPPAVRSLFPALATDAQRAIAFVRSLPVATALVGMRSREHLEENLVAGAATGPGSVAHL